MISIHALLAESDHYYRDTRNCYEISIHALLAESDTIFAVRPYDAPIFLSTLSLRRATWPHQRHFAPDEDFYPRSPCGERQYLVRGQRPNWGISIHALLAESDQPRKTEVPGAIISIHALLAESDLRACPVSSPRRYFYPRSPCGERQAASNHYSCY